MQFQSRQDRINQTIQSTLKNLSNLIDVNTVVGTPIKTQDGEYIVPVSKVTVGVLSGGGEYGKLGIFKKSEELPYSAGNGSIISIKPCGFLLKENGSYKVLSVPNTPYEKLIEKTTDFISELNKNEEV